jgi:ABC-type sulfate transport system permease component
VYLIVNCVKLLFMLKQQAEIEQKRKERKKEEALQTLKTTILVSAAIVAVAGVVCAVAKKLREK